MALKKNSGNILTKIENEEIKAGDVIMDSFKKNFRAKDQNALEMLKILTELYKQTNEKIAKELGDLCTEADIESYNKRAGEMAREMFRKKYGSIEEVEKDIRSLIATTDWENFEEMSMNKPEEENKSFLQKVKENILKTTSKVFNMAKDSFKSFVQTFRVEAVQVLEEIKKDLKEPPILTKEIKDHLLKLNDIIDKKILDIEKLIESKVEKTKSIIREKENVNIYPSYFKDYVFKNIWGNDQFVYYYDQQMPWYKTHRYSGTLCNDIRDIKDKLNSHLEQTPVSVLTQWLHKDYFKDLFNFHYIDDYAKSCWDISQTFWNCTISESHHRMETIRHDKSWNFLWIIPIEKAEYERRRYIKPEMMLQATDSMKRDLIEEIKKLHKSLKSTVISGLNPRNEK